MRLSETTGLFRVSIDQQETAAAGEFEGAAAPLKEDRKGAQGQERDEFPVRKTALEVTVTRGLLRGDEAGIGLASGRESWLNVFY